jgi:uncharacterized protein YcbK (DUF882 family)
VSFSEGDILPTKRAIGAQTSGRTIASRALLAPLLVYLGFATGSTESAIANGDTRTINLSNSHTNESGAFTYMVNGSYNGDVLEKLNWFLRDWRLNEPTKMDPKLFDIVWEVYRESGSTQPIDVLSGYRSPQTNAMLRMRSRQVAEHSQHMQGRAMDAHFLDVSTSRIRDISMRMQAGGIGFYPTGNTPWVHLDSGSVRYWPRISHDQMVRLFPDGKTVFVPADGVPLAGYELARAEIEARGGDVIATNSGGKGSFNLFSWLFGGQNAGGADDAEEGAGSNRAPQKAAPVQVASNSPDVVAKAKRNLPKGETFLKAADPVVASIVETPQAVAAPEAKAIPEAAPTDLHAAAFIAPLPPRKPADLYASLTAPLPPVRPAEFAFAAPGPVQVVASSDAGRKNDLIAALLARGRLPGVITRGVTGPIPANALALVDIAGPPEPPERPALLAKAEALEAPIPPVFPVRMTNAGRASAAAPKAQQASAQARPIDGGATSSIGVKEAALSTPFGDLPVRAFGATPAVTDGTTEAALYQMSLRGSAN